MVSLVLVSHSLQLAEGLADMLAQIGTTDVPVRVAAGTEDGRLGTSSDLVAAAIGAADNGDGVVVIPDLGSAVLSVRLALEAYDASDRVILVDAPFVEGAVAAAVTAASGADLDGVADAARQAREISKL